MKKLNIVLLLILQSLMSISASATLIEFEGLTSPGTEVTEITVNESGFTLTANDNGLRVLSETFGGTGLTNPTGDFGFIQNSADTITLSGDSVFSINSMNLGMLFSSSAGNVAVTGNLFGGGTISTLFNVVNVSNNGGSFASYVFDSSWINLTSIDIHRDSGIFMGIDNISVNAQSVPDPSTLVIFALGAMGLFSRRLKKQ